MKINPRQHITRRGVVKRNPKREEWIAFNYTDGITASHNTFPTKEATEDFIRLFKNRYKAQGYYLTSRRERIRPEDVDVKAIKANDIGKALIPDKNCVTCGQTLSAAEIRNGEDTCYPCQKGNTEESQRELR